LKRIVLVVDAMGVPYESADDVAELLVPFVNENGGCQIPEQSNANIWKPAWAELALLRSGETLMFRRPLRISISPVID
jgi:hypothetical protein